jgi:hypothetical protein
MKPERNRTNRAKSALPPNSSTRNAGRKKTPLQKMLDEAVLEQRRRHERQIADIEAEANELARRAIQEGYSREMALVELESARLGAMKSFPIQAQAAVNATLAKAKLMGLIIDKQAILHGTRSGTGGMMDLHGDVREARRQVIESLRERFGTEKTARLLAVFEDDKPTDLESNEEN